MTKPSAGRGPTLITGAAGQVGQDLLRELRGAGDEVHGADLRDAPAALADLPGLRWHRLDVTDAQAVDELVARLAPRRVFHLAAILSARGEGDPQRTWRINMEGLRHVLEACRGCGAQLVFASTVAVFGPGLPEPVGDDVPLHPATMYGVTKVAGELLGEYYHRRWGLDFRGLRFPGLISASEPGGGSSDYALYLYLEGLRSGSYECYCRPETRIPLMYLPDGIRALAELAAAPRERLSRCVYNIQAFSPRADEIAAAVRAALGELAVSYAPCPVRQPILDSWPGALDDQHARADWGWSPRYDLASMTRALIPQMRELVAANRTAGEHTG